MAVFIVFLLSALLVAPEAEAARRKKRPVKAYSPPYASMVYDVNAGRVLQETHGTALRHPASVTKVMTLYMLFEQMERGRFKLDSELRVSAHAQRQPPSKLGVKAGETISVEDAIKALVTKSANDVAVVVAEALGGTEERFGEMMTAKARALGMTRSVFRNASGLPNPQQVTTARDLVILGQAIQDRFPRQYAFFGTRSFEYEGGVYRNHNRLLGKVEGVDGIKTGYTRASGFNLLTSAKVDGRHIITVVLGGRSARARDVQVASLVESHMERAVAGRRTPRTTDVARAETDEESRPEPRVAIRPVVPAPVAALPPQRPRPAVVAETNERQPELTKSRPLALAASGSTNAAQGATTPLALVSTTPRNPAFRPQEQARLPEMAPPRTTAAEGRIVPPGSVRYTNSANAPAAKGDVTQPLPVVSQPVAVAPKTDQRLADAPVKSMPSPAPRPELAASAPQTSAKAATLASQPARSGWVIQLAAAESETKARTLLDSARGKNTRLLKEAEAFTEAVSKGGSTLYRARFAGFDADEAQEACKSLKRTGFNCFAQKL